LMYLFVQIYKSLMNMGLTMYPNLLFFLERDLTYQQ
jgi:hypothetical protein